VGGNIVGGCRSRALGGRGSGLAEGLVGVLRRVEERGMGRR
jgi:hypothetical protein